MIGMLSKVSASLFPEIDSGFMANLVLTMPAVDVSPVPNSYSDVAREVLKAHEEVERESPPLPGERYQGKVPVYIDDTRAYAGVTEFGPVYRNRKLGVEAKRMGISRHVPLDKVKRVAKHELRHVQAEKLVEYADVPEHLTRLVVEAYAEFDGIMHGSKDEAREIEHTTPYPQVVKFARYVHDCYRSERTGKPGFRAFVEDVIKYESMHAALENLGRNIKKRMIN